MANQVQDSGAEAQEWVAANRRLVDEVFQRFLNDGEWPDIPSLQRQLDRWGTDVDVQSVAAARPRVLNESSLIYMEKLTLHLRHLMWVERAQPLVAKLSPHQWCTTL